MARLIYNYSVMNSGKSLHLLQVAYNYRTNNRKVLIIKPDIDNRFGSDTTEIELDDDMTKQIEMPIGEVKSRLGVSSKSILITRETNLYQLISDINQVDVLLVDEAQFLSKEQIDQLSDVVDYLDIDVLCYGIKTDAFGNLFEGSKRLLEISDKLNELKQICHCGTKAVMHLKYNNGVVVNEGEQVDIGAEEKYESVCRFHWKEAKKA